MKNSIVISLGGSLIVPNEIDVNFLKKFRKLIIKHIKKTNFFLICGGGRICRYYQSAARKITNLTNDDLDWLGIYATRLNAQLVRIIFGKIAYSVVLDQPKLKRNINNSVVVSAGWKPGRSTDYVAIQIAKKCGAKEVINLTNVDSLYDKNPYKFKSAKPIYKINWKSFLKITGNRWSPGLNLPFDPIAAKLAEKSKIKVSLINGSNLKEVDNYLKGKKFKGTIIGE